MYFTLSARHSSVPDFGEPSIAYTSRDIEREHPEAVAILRGNRYAQHVIIDLGDSGQIRISRASAGEAQRVLDEAREIAALIDAETDTLPASARS